MTPRYDQPLLWLENIPGGARHARGGSAPSHAITSPDPT
jgi:hypothetical protein